MTSLLPPDPTSARPSWIQARVRWSTGPVILGTAAALALVLNAGRIQHSVLDWRSRQFVKDAGIALQAGHWREAELALTSAVATQPDNPQLRIALGTFYLRNNRPAEGLRWYREAVLTYPPAQAQALLHACASELILGGNYAELALLAQQQLADNAPFAGLWLNLAQNGLRLSGKSPSPALLNPRLDSVSSQLLRAQSEINAGQTDLAAQTMSALGETRLSFSAATVAARIWLAVGDESRARATVRYVNRILAPDEIRHFEALFHVPSQSSALRAAQSLEASPTAAQGRVLAAFMLEHLAQPYARVSVELTNRLRSHERSLPVESLTLLWLYSGFARDAESEHIWRGRIEERTSTTLPPLDSGKMTEPLLRLLLSKARLPFEIVCELMALTERPVATSPATPAARTLAQWR